MATHPCRLLKKCYTSVLEHNAMPSVCSTRGKHRRMVLLVFLLIGLIIVWWRPFSSRFRPSRSQTVPVSDHQKADVFESRDNLAKIMSALVKLEITSNSKFTDLSSPVFHNFLNINETIDTTMHSLCESERVLERKLSAPSVSLIFSFYNIISEWDAMTLLGQNVAMLLSNLTDDVIMTAEDNLSSAVKDKLEKVVDMCSVCRLFFFHGNIFQHRNEASRFARNQYLIFLDARVRLTPNWLQPLIHCLQVHKKVIASPQLRLSYADGSGHQEGFSRNEVMWDLSVSSGAVGNSELVISSTTDQGCLRQTVISKEVFGVHKEFFTELGGFDLIPGATGGEHVSFSLKVLNCKGNIVTSLCSHVFLTVLNTAAERYAPGTPNDKTSHTEFSSLSFNVGLSNVSAYYVAVSAIWIDSSSSRFYLCATHLNDWIFQGKASSGHVTKFKHSVVSNSQDNDTYLKSRYRSYGASLKEHMVRAMCEIRNLMYIIHQRQPDTLAPTKFATHYGYIRTMNGMYAFGIAVNSPSLTLPRSHKELQGHFGKLPTWSNFLLTRNASLWFGPFSFTNGAFIYKNVWCMTVGPHNQLIMTKCAKGLASQLFVYKEHVIRPAGVLDRCVCATKSTHVSSVLLMRQCQAADDLQHFHLDIHFTETCVN